MMRLSAAMEGEERRSKPAVMMPAIVFAREECASRAMFKRVCGCCGAKPKAEPVNSQAATKAWRRLLVMVEREEIFSFVWVADASQLCNLELEPRHSGSWANPDSFGSVCSICNTISYVDVPLP